MLNNSQINLIICFIFFIGKNFSLDNDVQIGSENVEKEGKGYFLCGYYLFFLLISKWFLL